MSFDKLMAELQDEQSAQEALAKALPAEDGNDDQTIAAAAEDGGESATDGKNKDGGKGGEAVDDKPMAKSFTVKLADGTEVEAVDGEAMIKSLTERLDNTESTLGKALEQTVGLIKSQSAMIKSLGEQIGKLRGEGRGRKAVVVLNDKQDVTTPLAKSDEKGMRPDEFMAKAMGALNAGRLTGYDISLAESCINSGKALPADLVQRVMA